MSGEVAPIPVAQLTDEMQQFPRIMLFEFSNDASSPSQPVASLTLLDAWPNAFPNGLIPLVSDDSKQKTQGYRVPSSLGNKLKDNSRNPDGYRFHDVFHIAIMAILGWSPVMRSMLGVKRRADPRVDEIDDGGRAIVSEEGLFALLGMRHVKNGASVEEDATLRLSSSLIQDYLMSCALSEEVPHSDVIMGALLEGARVFQQVRDNLGGYVLANLDAKSVIYVPKENAR
jgi:hypothetical protein